MRRFAKSALVFTLSMSMLLGMSTVGQSEVEAAKVKLDRTKVTMYVGNKVKLKVKNYKKKVKWSTSKKKVATVSSKGLVKAKKAGKAVITAKAGKKKLTCKVTVKKKDDNKVIATAVPSIQPTQVPTAVPTLAPTTAPTAQPTSEPTATPEPTPTPEYMQEGAFVYDKLDISWIDPEKPMIAITFDDGPVGSSDTSNGMRILKVLEDNNCHATFNYITSLINDNTKDEILKAMEIGCEIGNHTTGYTSLSEYSPEKIQEDVEAARAKLEEITGISNFTLRPPNLALNNDVYHNVNVPMIGSSVFSNDWTAGITKDQIINNCKNVKDGDIILMHETNAETVEAIEYLVPYYIEQGFQIVSVVELFAVKDIPLFPENYYNCTYRNPDKPSN